MVVMEVMLVAGIAAAHSKKRTTKSNTGNGFKKQDKYYVCSILTVNRYGLVMHIRK